MRAGSVSPAFLVGVHVVFLFSGVFMPLQLWCA